MAEPGIKFVGVDREGNVHVEPFPNLPDALHWLNYCQGEAYNWGKLFEVRATDGKYVFHAEFQQRFNLRD